jgi:general stress protein YciG
VRPKKEITLREHMQSIAARGGKARAKALTAGELSKIGRKGGKKGGKARATALTPERRKEIAKKAAAKRWAKTDKSQ